MLRRLDRGDDVADRDRHVDHLGLPRAQRLDPGQGQQRLGQPVHPLGVLGEAVEEVVARLRVVLGAAPAGPRSRRRCRPAGCAARGRRWRRSRLRRTRGASRRCGRGRPRARRARRAASGPASRRRGRRSAAPGGRRSRPRRRGAAAAASPPAGWPSASSRSAAALLEKRTGPSSSTTITASVRPSKIASSLLRSAVSTPKLSFSEARIESRARARSPISSRAADLERRVEGAAPPFRPRPGRGATTRWEIADGDQEAGEDADQHRGDQRLLVVAEEVDGAGGDQR